MSKTNSFLHSGEVGNIGLKQLREERELVASKWEKFGLLEGLTGAMRENIATLYENQASFMLNESTTTDSSGAFETVAFPVIRRIFAKLLANEIVSVQALNMPIGRLYFMNPKISVRNANGRHNAYDGAYSNAARMDASAKTQYSTNSLYDSLYATAYGDEGTSLFDTTKGGATTVTGTPSFGNSITYGTTQALTTYISGFSLTDRGHLVGAAGNITDTEEFIASLKIVSNTNFVNPSTGTIEIPAGTPLTFRTLAQKYAKPLVNAAGLLMLEIDLSCPDNNGFYVKGYSAFTDSSAVTFTYSYKTYSDLEEDSEMAEISFDFDYVTVDVGGARMLKATYTPQIQQDISAFHSIDVEAELTALLSETVSMEIDREILRDLRRGAAWLDRWDYRGYDKRVTSGGIALTRKDYNQELITVVNRISAQIQKSTLRGGANWIVVSPEIGAVLNDLEYFHVTNAEPEEVKYSLGIEKVGTLSNRYQVYVDTYAPADTLLMGHKGDGILHAGYIYAPYCPLMLFPKLVDPRDFKNVLGVATRYAKKMVNNRFYGKVIVDGLKRFPTSDFIS